MKELGEMSCKDLEDLATRLIKEIDARKRQLDKTREIIAPCDVEYLAEVTCDYGDKPYLCRWVLEGEKLERKFFDLGRTKVNGKTVISTVVELCNGWAIEERLECGKRCGIVHDGEVTDLGRTDTNRVLAVKQYLSGRLDVDELLKLSPDYEEPEPCGVIDDLKE